MNKYDKKDKTYIYYIIDLYISGKIDERQFCDEFYYSYDLELDYSTLTEKESALFLKLDAVASRFSEYPKDHTLDPKAFTNAETLRKKIIETNIQLHSTDAQ